MMLCLYLEDIYKKMQKKKKPLKNTFNNKSQNSIFSLKPRF